ncbi:MAG: diaminopimelate decarboxylase [Burkholderiales bacterium]|nr:diaminopimelate decarboxylase [Burkholderiales bacterium]
MSAFALKGGVLHAEDVALPALAEEFGTPCYVYSRAAITAAYSAFERAFAPRPHLICYAVKANSNIAVLNVLARLGAGFDIVSGGELLRVLAAGGDPGKTIFSGVGKTATEIRLALAHGIMCFNVESGAELDRIDRIAGEMGKRAAISFRVNPDVDAKTHRYISTGLKENKFGVAYAEAIPLYRRAAALPNIEVTGIDFHLGSKMMDPAPAVEAAGKVFALLEALAAEGIALSHFDVGGGLGVPYEPGEGEADLAGYARGLLQLLEGRSETLVFEPGRYLVGNAGVLLTRVEYLKPGAVKNFAVVDAAMNDLIRPALYEAYHAMLPVTPRAGTPSTWQIVGPVCESADFLGHDRALALADGDLLAVMSAGAYGFVMSSNYNTRGRACEVMVDGARAHLIRERESAPLLFCHESILPR